MRARFEAEVMPHLDAAYSLARWLVRDEQVAQDIVQDALLRAFTYFGRLRPGPARPWILAIVRNVCNSWFEHNKRFPQSPTEEEEDALAELPSLDAQGQAQTPETLLLHALERAEVNAAVMALALPFREVIVLREIEELSYEEIAQVLKLPPGTVMSRLSRARAQLRLALQAHRPARI